MDRMISTMVEDEVTRIMGEIDALRTQFLSSFNNEKALKDKNLLNLIERIDRDLYVASCQLSMVKMYLNGAR